MILYKLKNKLSILDTFKKPVGHTHLDISVTDALKSSLKHIRGPANT